MIFSKSKIYFILKLVAYLCIFIKCWKRFFIIKVMQGTVNRYLTWFGHGTGLIYVWIRGSSRLIIGKGGWYCKRNFLQTLESQRLASLHWGHLDPPLNSIPLNTAKKKNDASNNNSDVHVHVLHFKVQIAPNYQCCQLSWIIREDSRFGPYLLVSRNLPDNPQCLPFLQ